MRPSRIKSKSTQNPASQSEESKIDLTSPYETEIVIFTLTMSDLDELKPLVINDSILESARAKVDSYG